MSERTESHRMRQSNQLIERGDRPHAVLAGAAVAMALAILCVLGWLLGVVELAAFGADYVPMAPTMILLVFLLGVGLLVHGLGSARIRYARSLSPGEGVATGRSFAARSAVATASVLVVIVATAVLLRSAGAFHYDFEQVLADRAGTLGGSSTGRMPWLAAVLVECAGLALLGLQWPRAPRAVLELISVLTVAVAGLSLAILMGYAYGAPLLYKGATIPVALPTAVAFLSLAVGLIAAVPGASRVVAFFRGPTMRARLLRAFLPTTLVLVLLVGWAGNAVLDSGSDSATLWRWVLTLGSTFAVALIVFAVTRRTGDAIDQAQGSARQQAADGALEFAESVINTVREPLISLDQDLRVVTVSRSFYDFFKVRPEDTVGQLIYDLGNKQWDIPQLRELLETILPESTSFDNYEVEHEFATIGKRTMLLNARQIDQGLGKERIILLAIEDITERKAVEAGLEETRKELEAFAYSVSHDLRAPLRGIDGWSLALLEDYKDKLGEQGSEYIDLVRSETQRMGNLIDDLLMFSRQSRAEMKEERLDMTAMVKAIATRLRQQTPSLKAEFVIQPGLTALGDPGLIGAALTNLLDNAVKFSNGSSPAVIEFGQSDQEGKRTFFVRDNGVGFDMAYSQKLFGVFQRLHSVSEFPGTGIGLASVQRIISRHGGRIWAEAKPDEGATFHFTLKEAS